MHLSRLTTAVALATAMAVPAMSAPAHAVTSSVTTYNAVTGFNPSRVNGTTGHVVTVRNGSGAVAAFQASWEATPRVLQNNTSVAFTPMTTPAGTVTAVGTGVAGSVYVIAPVG
jgi:hypothetical protein